MSENDEDQIEIEVVEDDGSTPHSDWGSPDPALQLFANITHAEPEIQLGVTLTVNGSVITGALIGKSAWISEQAVAYEEELGGMIRTLGRLIDDPRDADRPLDTYGFIHLKDAHYVSGTEFYPAQDQDGFFWRGRLADVSGWSFGVLQRKQD